MDETTICTTFRDLSVPPSLVQEAYLLAKVKSKEGKRHKKHKRVHCLRNPHVCESCFKVWREDEVTGNEKRLFGPVKDGVLRHRGGCSGLVRPYSQISRNAVVGLATEKVFHRDFFPSMGNLIREDMPDISHHNCVCTGTCCRTDFFPSMGPEPSPMATFDVVISHPTLHGWEEQAHKTCAAASVAGALNCALQAYGEPTTQLASVQRASSAGHMFQRVKSSGAANEGSGGGRVIEQDVIDYYCKWSREAGKINCHAALRGSCGLIPSTRKIGNPRLLRACHAVGATFLSNELDRNRKSAEVNSKNIGGAGGVLSLPKVGGARVVESEDDEEEEEDTDEREDVSPVETLRLMGNWMCRDRIEEGGRCAPDDASEIEDEQWERVKAELREGSSLLLHFRNHYALVFAAREWQCESTGAWRRQLLTATQKQRPHVWFCFRQLRADIVYSKVNQMLLIRRSLTCGPLPPNSLPPSSLPSSASSAASGCDTASGGEGRCRERGGA